MEALELLVVGVPVASAVIAIVYAARAGRAYKQVGRLGELWIAEDDDPAERDLVREDIEQMLGAIEAARRARGHHTDA